MIIADTHALIWWINGQWQELSQSARAALDHTDTVGVAAITCWEIALLTERRRIAIHGDLRDWLDAVTRLPGIVLLPLSVEVATRAVELREALRDPADCLIVATALTHSAPLVTRDARIRASSLVTTIW